MGNQGAASTVQQSDAVDNSSASEDFESEYIEDFELADAPPSPQTEFDISGFQEQEYFQGRMAFLFGQYEMAYKIWAPLADHGYAKAQATLGWMYHTGKGVEKDLSQAYQWYEKAAKQNHPVAQNNLGVFYEQGLFVGKSATSAAKWYREAAEWGYPFAQYNLGILYLEGRGLKKDEKEAQFWLQIAALQGVEQAIQVLQEMSVTVHGSTVSVSPGKGPQWSKSSASSSSEKTKSPHNTPHGSSRYKDIFNRIKSSEQTSMQGFDYGNPPPVSTTSTASNDAGKATGTQTPSNDKQLQGTPDDHTDNSQSESSASSVVTVSKSGSHDASIQIKKQQQPSSRSKSVSTGTDDSEVKPASDELLPGDKFDQWLAEAQVAQKRLKELENEKRTNSHSLKIYNDEWVKEQNPANYTLQLARSDKLDWLLNIAKKQPMLKDTAYYTSMIDGKKWYYLIYGNFENQQSASNEIEKLPKALKKWSPWVRKFSEVQSKMHAEKE